MVIFTDINLNKETFIIERIINVVVAERMRTILRLLKKMSCITLKDLSTGRNPFSTFISLNLMRFKAVIKV